MSPRGVAKCRHRWVRVADAPEYQGLPCSLWKCEGCGRTVELFSDVIPRGAVHE